MPKFLAFIGSTVGGSIGWWLGSGMGLMVAFLFSTVGSGVGLYYGLRWGREHFG